MSLLPDFLAGLTGAGAGQAAFRSRGERSTMWRPPEPEKEQGRSTLLRTDLPDGSGLQFLPQELKAPGRGEGASPFITAASEPALGFLP